MNEDNITEVAPTKRVEPTKIDNENLQANPITKNEDKVWQEKLLPFMMASLIILTIVFIISSYFEFRDFKTRLHESSRNEELIRAMNVSSDNLSEDQSLLNENKPEKVAYVKWRSLLLLEREALIRRYSHSQTIIFSRMWTRYLGFITGMILAIVGAVFILGKLREEISEFSGESQLLKVNLKSASPGIILAVLGTILLLTTLAVQFDVNVKDGNIYLDTQQKPADIDFGNSKFSTDDDSTNQSNNNNSQSEDKEDKRRLEDARKLELQNSSK